VEDRRKWTVFEKLVVPFWKSSTLEGVVFQLAVDFPVKIKKKINSCG
jgi:hypothetical protein